MARSRNRSGRRERHHLFQELARRFGDHELPVYASAIAFRAIVALIPLVLLGLGLLGALGLKDTWHNSIGPAIEPLLLTAYVFVSSAIFLVGAEVDELLRKETDGRGFALPDLAGAVFRR